MKRWLADFVRMSWLVGYISELKKWNSLITLDFKGAVLTRYDDQSGKQALPRRSPGRKWVFNTKATSPNLACQNSAGKN